MKILVTGVAGFIGFHTAINYLNQGYTIIGIDNLNNYYSILLKKARLQKLIKHKYGNNFKFIKIDISENKAIANLFNTHKFNLVIHLAAQAGVRYSIQNPYAYAQSNLIGFLNVLEGCRKQQVNHLVYASSSSVYGLNTKLPFSEKIPADHPISFYGATKRSNELMAHSYSSLYNISTTGLRFFTVYGPWGRPDMALFKFTKAILEESVIDVYNHGNHMRDFTYIDDIVNGIIKIAKQPAKVNYDFSPTNPEFSSSSVPWRIYNIGNSCPIKLMKYIQLIEKYIGKKAIMRMLPLQTGDVPNTFADVKSLTKHIGYKPSTSVEDGIYNFIAWYKNWYSKCVV